MREASSNRRVTKPRRFILPFLALVLGLSLLLCSGCIPWLRWTTNVSDATSSERLASLIPDGSGGAYVVWMNEYSGNFYSFAQHVDVLGRPQWGSGGEEVCAFASTKGVATAASDGMGGIVVAWADKRSGNWDIYAQHLGSGGRWYKDGRPICVEAGDQLAPQVVNCGASGEVTVFWLDNRTNGSTDIYAQRLNAGGFPVWTAGGVAVCNVPGSKSDLEVVKGGRGFVAAWTDMRDATPGIYAQSVDYNGNVVWPAGAVKIADNASAYDGFSMAGDEFGRAFLAWEDQSSSSDRVCAQRVDRDGTLLWPAGGVSVCNEKGEPSGPDIIGDDMGGAIVTWCDSRANDGDIYAQKINPDGSLSWAPAGKPVSVARGPQEMPKMTRDGAGGAIITWTDGRFIYVPPGQPAPDFNYDVFVARVDSSGKSVWEMDITPSGLTQVAYDVVPGDYNWRLPNYKGGAIVAWAADTDVNPKYTVYDMSVTRVQDWPLSSTNQQQLLKEYNKQVAEYNKKLDAARRSIKAQ